MPRDAAKRMKPELMWAISREGRMITFPLWRQAMVAVMRRTQYPDGSIVRVRVTQYKPRLKKIRVPTSR